MNIFKLSLASSLAVGLSFMMLACDDSSSSGPDMSAEPSSSSESVVPASSDDNANSQSSSSEAGDERKETVSSSSNEKNVPSSSSAEQCYKDGMAKVTLKSVENVKISCPNSMTYYNWDLQIFYKCEGAALIEVDMPPCESDEPVSSSSGASSSSIALSGIVYGSLHDIRDGKIYKTVEIEGKTWMAENLNFYRSLDGSIVLDSAFCYDDVITNCDKYGRLYQEDAAVKACPEGWRLPTDEEWSFMRNTVKIKNDVDDVNIPLRAVGAWDDKVSATNASGFSAIPAGYRTKGGIYDGEGTRGYFWGENDKLYYGWILSRQYELEKESLIRGYYAYSVRCVLE